jgi:hypothetical protein
MDVGVVSGFLQFATQERVSHRDAFSLERRREQKASHRERLRRRGAVCGVGAPLRCAEASPSSRLLASGPAALATPLHTLFQQPASAATGQALSGQARTVASRVTEREAWASGGIARSVSRTFFGVEVSPAD